MNIRRSILLIIAMGTALVGMGARGSYVIDAEGANIGTDVIATGADFDFVAHDFGIESTEALQITLANLSRATNLRGNLLLRSFRDTGNSSSDGAALDAPSSAEPTGTTELLTTDGNEDYSYYDEGAADGDSGGLPVLSGESLPASVQNLPEIDTNAIFWILKPAEFTSFSQMTAARFGF